MECYRNNIIKKTDKGSCDYLMEAEKQLSDKKVYQEVSNSENILSELAEMSSKMRGYITEKQLKYFSYE